MQDNWLIALLMHLGVQLLQVPDLIWDDNHAAYSKAVLHLTSLPLRLLCSWMTTSLPRARMNFDRNHSSGDPDE